MPGRMKFQPVTMTKEIKLNAKQEACLIELFDAKGNAVELAMTREFGAQLVANTQSAFIAIEDRKWMEEGITAEERRSFASESARLATPFTASANPHGTPLSSVLVTIARASTFQQSFGLTVDKAEALAAELLEAATQMRTLGQTS